MNKVPVCSNMIDALLGAVQLSQVVNGYVKAWLGKVLDHLLANYSSNRLILKSVFLRDVTTMAIS